MRLYRDTAWRRVLLGLYAHPDSTLSDLATYADIDETYARRVLSRLRSVGLTVQRLGPPRENGARRRILVSLSTEGIAAAKVAEEAATTDDIIKRYTSGESIWKIAAATGRSYGSIQRQLKAANVTRPVGRRSTRT